MRLSNENEIRLWSLTFASVAGNPNLMNGEDAADAADFAVKKLRTRLEERRGDALFVADREAFKQRARQAAQDLGHAEAGQGGPEPYLSLDDFKTESSPMVQNLQKLLLDALARSDKPEFNRLLSLLVAVQQAARKDEK